MKEIDLGKPHKFFFETLGSETRWSILRLLQKEPLRSTDISKKLNFEQSLVSHHLKRLETCGFVHVDTKGTERIYSLNKETVGELLKLVDKHVNNFCKKACCK